MKPASRQIMNAPRTPGVSRYVLALLVLGASTSAAQPPNPALDLTGEDYWVGALAIYPAHQAKAEYCTASDGIEEPALGQDGTAPSQLPSPSLPDWGISGFEGYDESPYQSEPVDEGLLKVWLERAETPPLRLFDIESYIISGNRRYAAVWSPDPATSVLGLALDSLDQESVERTVNGDVYSLFDFECYPKPAGQEFIALYHPAKADPSGLQIHDLGSDIQGLQSHPAASSGCLVDLERCGDRFVGLFDGGMNDCEIALFPDTSDPDADPWGDFHHAFHGLVFDRTTCEVADNPQRVVELEYFPGVGYAAVLGSLKEGLRDWLLVTDSWTRLQEQLGLAEVDSDESPELPKKEVRDLEVRDILLGVPAIPPADLTVDPQHNSLHGEGPDEPPIGV